MPQPILAPVSGDMIALLPQDNRAPFSWTRALSLVLSVLVIGIALYQLRTLDLGNVLAMVPTSPFFWVLFALGIMAGPLSEWFIFNRLWGVGSAALGALTRKLVYNELLLGYLGEAWFYAWARKHGQVPASPFGAVKDVAVLSAIAGNVMTLLLLAMAIPFFGMLDLGQHGSAVGWSLAFVLGSSLAVMVWRKSLFSLTPGELRMTFTVHVARIVATTLLAAAMWHFVLPETPLGWWLLLAAIRLLISRLPFVPNKDIVFASVAVLAVGHQLQIAELMTMMAGLILAANLLLGLGMAATEIAKGERKHAVAA